MRRIHRRLTARLDALEAPAAADQTMGHDWRDVPGRSSYHRYCHRCGVRDVETMSTTCPGK